MIEIDIAKLTTKIREEAEWLASFERHERCSVQVADYTQLCALRATLRGRVHFSPNTNLAEAYWILGVPCQTGERVVDGHTVYDYTPITLEIQRAWVEPLFAQFAQTAVQQ